MIKAQTTYHWLIAKVCFFAVLFFICFSTTATPAHAATPIQCSSSISKTSIKPGDSYTVSFTLPSTPCSDTSCFDILFCKTIGSDTCNGQEFSVKVLGGSLQRQASGNGATISTTKSETQEGNWKYWLTINSLDNQYCINQDTVSVSTTGGAGSPTCGANLATLVGTSGNQTLSISPGQLQNFPQGSYDILVAGKKVNSAAIVVNSDKKVTTTNAISANVSSFCSDTNSVTGEHVVNCPLDVSVVKSGTTAALCSKHVIAAAPPEKTKHGDFNLCKQIPDTDLQSKCTSCYDSGGTWTAVGCINTSDTGEALIGTIVKIGLGIAGGVGLLMIITAGFMFTTSQGDSKRVGVAREMMTSAIIGLLFIVFSVTILQFIGVTILQVPGFGK